jgi:NhaP-type Na+/H+ or K+/H+ antiporter
VRYGVATNNKESPEHRESIRRLWAVLAFIANSAAFLIIGLSTDLHQLLVYIVLITIAYIAVFAARFVSVFSVLGLSKSAERRSLARGRASPPSAG